MALIPLPDDDGAMGLAIDEAQGILPEFFA
jgi:hypothetical protein